MRRSVRLAGRIVAALAALCFAGGAYVYLTLPDVRPLAGTNPDRTAFMDLRAREAAARGRTPRRVQKWVAYDRISPNLKRAVLVAEDAKFWQHEGVDFEQLKESIETNIERMAFARGASTITQQLAKNLYLSPSKNPIRKVRELLIARRLEAELTKQRILELYLNVIEWGDGIYGAEAAARTYFRKPASALGPAEAALLAGALVNARLLNPARPTPRLRRRQQMILARMGAAPGPVVADKTPSPPGRLSPEGPPPRDLDAPEGEAAPPLPGAIALPPASAPAPGCEAPPCG
jgi:monofunctional biosynthetic peptidoglycan transglycosylase